MGLVVKHRKKHNGVVFKSGFVYEFHYSAFENDPQPLIIFLNAIEGKHPNTGNQWRLIQGINLHYIPRKDRKKFIDLWMSNLLLSNGNIKLTWKMVKARYPYLQLGIRRYLLNPKYYIRNPREIPVDRIESLVKGSMWKDFSGALNRKLVKLKRWVMGRRK